MSPDVECRLQIASFAFPTMREWLGTILECGFPHADDAVRSSCPKISLLDPKLNAGRKGGFLFSFKCTYYSKILKTNVVNVWVQF